MNSKRATLLLAALLAATTSAAAAQEEVKPYTAEEVRPYRPQEPTPDRSAPRPAPSRGAQGAAQRFVGGWNLYVQGVHYSHDDVVSNTRTSVTSTGTRYLHRVNINPDGTFTWGRTRGRWRATGEGLDGWPVVLVGAYEGKDWKVGLDTRRGARPGSILVWDGSTWFNADPAR